MTKPETSVVSSLRDSAAYETDGAGDFAATAISERSCLSFAASEKIHRRYRKERFTEREEQDPPQMQWLLILPRVSFLHERPLNWSLACGAGSTPIRDHFLPFPVDSFHEIFCHGLPLEAVVRWSLSLLLNLL